MQQTTIQEILIAARKAYNEGRLGAQMGFTDGQYWYPETNGKRPVCAIGAVLHDTTADTVMACGTNGYSVHSLFTSNIISVNGYRDHPDIAGDLENLQEAHDEWAMLNAAPDTIADLRHAEDLFISCLSRLEAKYL